jgi:flagellar motor switch/type III secretory pathway protein FliN
VRSLRPFRWDLCPRITRPQLALLRVASAQLGLAAAGMAAGASALRALLGAPLRIAFGPARVLPSADIASFLGPGLRLCAVLERDGRRAVLALEPGLARALSGRALGMSAPEPALSSCTPVEEAVLELVLLTALKAGDGQVRLWGLVQRVAELPHVFSDPWVVLMPATVTIGEIGGRVDLLLPESLLLAAPPPLPCGERLSQIPCLMRVEVGRGRFSTADLRQIRLGDVVFLDELDVGIGGGHAVLRSGSVTVPVEISVEGRMIVSDAAERTAVSSEGALTVAETPRIPPDGRGDDRLANLDIEIVAELGRVVLSGREIAALAPGSVIELGAPLGGPIDLFVAGRLLARGELVDIDGELGVRVTELGR